MYCLPTVLDFDLLHAPSHLSDPPPHPHPVPDSPTGRIKKMLILIKKMLKKSGVNDNLAQNG